MLRREEQLKVQKRERDFLYLRVCARAVTGERGHGITEIAGLIRV